MKTMQDEFKRKILFILSVYILLFKFPFYTVRISDFSNVQTIYISLEFHSDIYVYNYEYIYMY